MLSWLTPRQAALDIAVALAAVLLGAWIFEWAGYLPCELCLMQRWAYYLGVPMAFFLWLANPPWLKRGLLLLGLVLLANAIFGGYHAGVEWGWWEGPTTCGSGSLTGGLPDLTKPAVMCNEAAIRIFGLSLAGYNALICGVLAAIAFIKAR